MDIIQGGKSGGADVRIVGSGKDVHYGRGFGGPPRRVFPVEQDMLAAVPR